MDVALSSAKASLAHKRRHIRDWREWNNEECGGRLEGRRERKEACSPVLVLLVVSRAPFYFSLHILSFFMKEPLRRRERTWGIAQCRGALPLATHAMASSTETIACSGFMQHTVITRARELSVGLDRHNRFSID